jgi:hypothetical protein
VIEQVIERIGAVIDVDACFARAHRATVTTSGRPEGGLTITVRLPYRSGKESDR